MTEAGLGISCHNLPMVDQRRLSRLEARQLDAVAGEIAVYSRVLLMSQGYPPRSFSRRSARAKARAARAAMTTAVRSGCSAPPPVCRFRAATRPGSGRPRRRARRAAPRLRFSTFARPATVPTDGLPEANSEPSLSPAILRSRPASRQPRTYQGQVPVLQGR